MNATNSFPYPILQELMKQCAFVQENGYYIIAARKDVKILASIAQAAEELRGIYVRAKQQKLEELRKRLIHYSDVYNLSDEREPWIFLSDQSLSFDQDLKCLLTYLNLNKANLRGEI